MELFNIFDQNPAIKDITICKKRGKSQILVIDYFLSQQGPINKSQMVDLHLNSTFRVISIMSHTHDVIKIDFKQNDQKMKFEDFSQVINIF